MSSLFERIARRLVAKMRPGAVSASYMEVERAELMFYAKALREGMTVFDVGANVGEITTLFSRLVGDSGCVHAFEACNATFGRLNTACDIVARRNIVSNNLGLADREGVVNLFVYDEQHSGWNSLAERPLHDYGIETKPLRVEEVRATTVDSYCQSQGISQIDLMKIDVEGAELQVLLGARRMFSARSIRCCVFEFGQTTFDMGNRPDQFEAYFEEYGYRLENIVKGDLLFPGRDSASTAQFAMHVATPKT